MDNRSSMAAILIIGIGLTVYAYNSPAPAQLRAAQQRTATTTTFSYAQLSIADGQYTWDIGGLEAPRTRSLNATIRFLGSQQKATFINLLNAIGLQGWELVDHGPNPEGVDQWVFKRRN